MKVRVFDKGKLVETTAEDILNKSVSEIVRQGVDMLDEAPETSEDQLSLPSDLTALSSKELGKLYTGQVAWSSHLEVQVSKVDVLSTETQKALDNYYSYHYQLLDGTKPERDAVIRQKKQYKELSLKASMYDSKYKMLAARLKAFDRSAGAVSREMSRRQMMAERSQRSM